MSPRFSRDGKIDSANTARAKLQIMQGAYDQLQQRQSVSKTLLGSFLGAVVALLLFAILAVADTGMLLLYLVPVVPVGLGARLLGHCFEWPLLLIPAIVCAITYLITFTVLLPFDALDLIVVPLGITLGAFLANKPLTKVEKNALWQARLGRLKKHKPGVERRPT